MNVYKIEYDRANPLGGTTRNEVTYVVATSMIKAHYYLEDRHDELDVIDISAFIRDVEIAK